MSVAMAIRFIPKLTVRQDSVGVTNNSSEHCNEENDNDDNDPVEIEVGGLFVHGLVKGILDMCTSVGYLQ